MAVSSMRLSEIAEHLGGRVEGDADAVITSIEPIQDAEPGAIAFISNRKYIPELGTTRASAVLVSDEVAALPRPEGTSLVVLDDPYMGFALLLQHWTAQPRETLGQHPRAHVAESATIGADVNLHPFVYVGEGAVIGDRCDLHPGSYVGAGAVIGDDTTLGPNTVIHHDCHIGSRCKIYAGAVIGSDGFGFAPNKMTGLHVKIPQIGRVVIEDDVEIGANVTIDRASMGETRVGQGTKIDNLVQLGHSTSVGMGCFIVSQVGISGTTKVGHGVTIAGQAGIAGHVSIGDLAQVGAQAGVHADVPPGGRVLGSPAMDGETARRSLAVIRRLPEMRKRLRALEQRLHSLEGKDRADTADEAWIRASVEKASARWVACFNAQDSAGCAACYEPDAVMIAKPFGTFRGREEIEAFWKKLHDDGFADVEYVDRVVKVVDGNSAVLTSKWRMNKAQGVITEETWVVQANGEALLRRDNFEVQ